MHRPHPTFVFYRAHNVLVDGNTVVRCSNPDVASWGYLVQEGGDSSITYDASTNVVTNVTDDARLCTKRSVKLCVYFIQFYP